MNWTHELTAARLAALQEIRDACAKAGGPVSARSLSARTRTLVPWLRAHRLLHPARRYAHKSVAPALNVDKVVAKLLADYRAREGVLEAARANPGATQAELARFLGVTKQRVSFVLRRAKA